MHKLGIKVGKIAAALLLAVVPASAAISQFQTPVGSSTGGQPVSAKVTFTTSENTIDVLLENLQANPTSVTQCISGLFLTLDGGQDGGSLLSSSGLERTVAGNDTFTDGAMVPTGWSFSNLAGLVSLNVLGTQTAPANLVIGPPGANNLYSNANGSIAGNGPHNPFLGLSATFRLSVQGVTANTLINEATFQFNTSPGNTVTVPEPMTLGLAGLAAALLVRRKTRA